MGFGACGVGPSRFIGVGVLYKHRRITLGKNFALQTVYFENEGKPAQPKIVHVINE